MYIEYMTAQRVADKSYTEYDSKGGDYRPTWLIRTSDWQKVPGDEATDGYHTLSYVWEQSGEKALKANGKYGLNDDGHHRIIQTEKEWRYGSYCSDNDNQAPKEETWNKGKGPTFGEFLALSEAQKFSVPVLFFREVPVPYEVTYDELLQQVCKDFDIEYLWYDKICIDQTNKAEKQREIKQMHLIYSNARYTVALVPEVNVEDPEDFNRISWVTKYIKAKSKALDQMTESLWWKRSWTLEEVMMSTRILIVGRNAHFWSLADSKKGDNLKESDSLATNMLGFKEWKMKSANQVLRHAHFRTSTKEHDKIFALANIFIGIVDIDIDYSMNVSTVMNVFYRQLAQKDLSLMCFGSNLFPDGEPRYVATMDSYGLPSWTGVLGMHLHRPIADVAVDQKSDYTIDDRMQLHIKCRSYTLRPTKYDDFNSLADIERGKKAQENYFKVITSMDDFDDESEAPDWSQWCMIGATGCFPTHYHKPDDHVPFLSLILPLSLTEECDECVILGVIFDSVASFYTLDRVLAGYTHDYLSPVARKSADGSSYGIIGLILLKHFQYDEPRPTSQEYMDRMFSNLGCETQKFCIK